MSLLVETKNYLLLLALDRTAGACGATGTLLILIARWCWQAMDQLQGRPAAIEECYE